MTARATATALHLAAPIGDLELLVQSSGGVLGGSLSVPVEARGLVIFAHGSGSGRHSIRNRQVASDLVARGFGTLLFDLLTPSEEAIDAARGHLRFDIPLLAHRLMEVTDWVTKQELTSELPIGYFGASTGAGAALMTAAERPSLVKAVVSRGGRPDLAGSALRRVQAPTLLIVGGADTEVLTLNRIALVQLGGESALEVISGATHLFPEPGALERVSDLAGMWFTRFLHT